MSSPVLALPGLLCFWDFQEPAGSPRVARGPHAYALRDASAAPVRRADEGVFGPHSADFAKGSWLRLPAPDCPALNLHGPRAQVTVVAWLKRRRLDPEWCAAVAGLWNEATHRRQYCLFLGLGFHDVKPHAQVCGHVSSTGGKSPGHNCCNDAASGATPVPYERWTMAAMTYDGAHIRAYLDGRLDLGGARNPYAFAEGIHAGGDPAASDFTVGAVALPSTSKGPHTDHTLGMGNWFTGLLGGLAVFDRALTDAELARLHADTLPAPRP